MSKAETISIAALVALFVLVGALAAGVVDYVITNTGTVTAVGLEIYSDPALTLKVTSIDWGMVDPGATVEKMVYVLNTGNTAEQLSLTTQNWNPATLMINCTWNRQNFVVAAGANVTATFTLAVDGAISGVEGFTFDLVVVGTEF